MTRAKATTSRLPALAMMKASAVVDERSSWAWLRRRMKRKVLTEKLVKRWVFLLKVFTVKRVSC